MSMLSLAVLLCSHTVRCVVCFITSTGWAFCVSSSNGGCLSVYVPVWMLRRYKQTSVEDGVFRWGMGHSECKFRKGSPTTVVRKLEWFAVSCGIKIHAVHCLVLSQNMRVTDVQMDGQNYDSQDRASIAALCSKNWDSNSSLWQKCGLPSITLLLA